MYQHIKSKQLYTEVRDGPERIARSRWSMQARSATSGRWVWVMKDRLVEYQTPEMIAAGRVRAQIDEEEARSWARREMLLEMAWRLSRELPYNLGTAVTNIALAEYEGNLGVASAAIRDEIERLAATTDPEEDSE